MNDFTINYNETTIRFTNQYNGSLHCLDTIPFVKFVRDTAGCSLYDAKNFCNTFIKNFNNLEPNVAKVRAEIKLKLDNIEDVNVMLRIFENVQSNINQ